MINFGRKQQGHVGEDNTIATLNLVMTRYSVDGARIYVTGH